MCKELVRNNSFQNQILKTNLINFCQYHTYLFKRQKKKKLSLSLKNIQYLLLGSHQFLPSKSQSVVASSHRHSLPQSRQWQAECSLCPHFLNFELPLSDVSLPVGMFVSINDPTLNSLEAIIYKWIWIHDERNYNQLLQRNLMQRNIYVFINI